MKQFKIMPLSEEDYEDWTTFVKQNACSTIFHTLEWKKVLEQTFNYMPEYLVVKNSEEKVVGISPAFSIKTLFGTTIVSQPFFEYGGPIIDQGYEAAYNGVLDFYKYKVENERVKYIEIRVLFDGDEELGYFDKTGFSKEFKAYDFRIDIKDKNFKKDIFIGLYNNKLRNSIRKALRSGVKITEEANISAYYELYLKTMARLGSPPFPKALFENVKQYCRYSSRFTFAYLDDVPIAGLWTFLYNKRVSIVGNVSCQEYQKYNANDLLYNEQIEYAARNNFDVVDLGRTRPDSFYERYKKKWGATRCDLCSYVYPPSAGKDVNPYSYYLIFSKITKKMPWILTRTGIGPYLMKLFP